MRALRVDRIGAYWVKPSIKNITQRRLRRAMACEVAWGLTVAGRFAVLGSTAPITEGRIDELGMRDGQWVWVEGPVGDTGRVARAKRVVEVTPGINVRVASTDHGWWHPEGDPENLYDVNELNINNLISWSSGKTGVGANYKCILCKIYPMKDGE